jgi:hypothetical protein
MDVLKWFENIHFALTESTSNGSWNESIIFTPF